MKKIIKIIASLFLGLSLTACMSNKPYIGENGNWWIDGNDLGVAATGEQGEKGDKVMVSSIAFDHTEDDKDYYKITFNDGTSQIFYITRAQDGKDGKDGTNVTILNVELFKTEGNVDTYRVTFSNGEHYDFTVTNGKNGQDGTNGTDGTNGSNLVIISVAKTATAGHVDTYTITYSDGSTTTFTVTNATSCFNGHGVPENTLGEDGDMYINIKNWDFYKKEDGAWIKAGNLHGKSTLTGEGVPSNDLGLDGDIYVDTSSWDVYEKKDGVWTKTGNIRGKSTLSGTTNPLNTEGSNGDVYINTSSWDIFEKKDGVWTLTGNIRGKSMLTGSGAPANTVGTDGDVYIDKDSWDIYTKANGTWTQVGRIRGESPYIGDNGNWWVGDNDTGVLADPAKVDNSVPSDGLRFSAVTYGGEAGYFVSSYNGTDKDVVIPSYVGMTKVIGIEDSVFSGKTTLTSVKLSKFTSYIGNNAFNGCSNIQEIDVNSAKIKTIGDYAFFNCNSLTSFTFSDKLLSIGNYAFRDCSNLVSISISSGASIGNYAFQNCSNVTSIQLKNVKKIGELAFFNIDKVTTITIPNSVTSIGYSAFGGMSALESYSAPFTGGVRDFTFTSGETNSQEMLFGYVFGENNYSNSSSALQYYSTYSYVSGGYQISSVKSGSVTYYIPSSLRTVNITNASHIWSGAFYNCSMLATISLSNSLAVVSIDDYSFYNCAALNSFTPTNTIKNIGNYAFYNCSSLESISLGSSIETIGNYAFYNCTSLNVVNIGNKLVSIGSYAFYGCPGSINFDNGSIITEIGNNAFREWQGETITVPNSVKTIGNYSFAYCSNLVSITIPEGVTSIGERAFNNCTNLKSIIIPSTVSFISPYTFAGCSNLETVVFMGETVIGDYAFQACTKLVNINLDSVTGSIGNYAFYNCSSLKSINLVDGVTTIGSYAFSSCTSAKSLSIPQTVTGISDYAFNNCRALEQVYYNAVSCSVSGANNYIFYCGGRDYAEGTNVIIGNKVTSIPSYLFSPSSNSSYYFNVKTVSFEENSICTLINGYAFYNCTNLYSISMPPSLNRILAYAFSNCDNLQSATFTTSGWFYTNDSIGTYGTSFDVADPSTAATYLRYTYVSLHWGRTQ